MLRVYAAEFRDSWSAWLGVTVTFVVVNAALVLTLVIGYTGVAAVLDGRLSLQSSAAWTIGQALVLVCIVAIAIPVIGSATSLVVDSRRGSLARLALAGCTPGQVRGSIARQLAAVSLLCAPVGDVIAVAAMSPWLALMNYQARNEPSWVALPPDYNVVAIVATNLVCIALVVLGGARQARRASDIPALEALRQSQAPPRTPRVSVPGWLFTALLVGLVAASFLSVPVQLEHRYKETVSNLMVLGFLQIFIWCAILATVALAIVGPVTRWWTGLVRTRSSSWLMARATVSARADRLYKSAVPVIFTFAIGVGAMIQVDSLIRTMAASMNRLDLELPMWDTFVLQFGLPLAIALAGGIGSLLMMGRQRDAELALAGVAGATPAQRAAIPFFEALMIAVSSVLLSLVVIVPTLIFQAYSLGAAGLIWSPAVSAPLIAGTFACSVLVTAAATVLPTLPARRLPEPRVIARLVAE